MPDILNDHGIYSHFITDHAHYWQDGGLTYHSRYSTYDLVRGQEGDFWKPDAKGFAHKMDLRRQDRINREYMQDEDDHPHARCCASALDFLEKNHEEESWYLHLEYFDPHEPFFAPEKYQKLYSDETSNFDWPPYAEIDDELRHKVDETRKNYAALLSMCDEYLGKVLDTFDRLDLWKDTMLIVNTDHGFLLGEHNFFAKNYMPNYNELVNIPLFIWDPRSGEKDTSRKALVQTIDIAPTILSYFGIESPEVMLGADLEKAVAEDSEVRDAALFGHFGKHINVTDGRYVYMRAAQNEDNAPLYNYTVMPSHLFTPFSVEELKLADKELHKGFLLH